MAIAGTLGSNSNGVIAVTIIHSATNSNGVIAVSDRTVRNITALYYDHRDVELSVRDRSRAAR